MHTILTITLLLFATSVFAFPDDGQHSPPKGAETCYNYSTIAYDSVINSRKGVPPETAAGLSKIGPNSFDINLLKVITGAYFWKKSPHDYAMQVFYECVKGTL